jgi:hypothetical protein
MKRALSIGTLLLCLAMAGCALDDPAVSTDQSELQTGGDQLAPKSGPVTTAAVCGDGICTPGVEGCGNCPADCPCWQQGTICSGGQCVPICGDGYCSPGTEDCGLCPVDCPCPGGTECQNRQCVEPDPCGGDPCCGDICCRKPWLCEPQVP